MKSMLIAILAGTALAVTGGVHAQGWSPTKNVEIIVGSAPGGSNDRTARTVEKAIIDGRLIPTSLSVVNKPGGGSSIAFTYVSQRARDPHTLLIGTTALLTNHIVGRSKLNHKDFTPIASLFNDYVVFAVNAESSIKTGKDLADRLKEDPKSLAIGFATALGSHNHIAAGMLAKSIGINPRDLKVVAFKGSKDAITQLLGGHIDMVTTAAGNVSSLIASGQLRVVGVSATQRFGGALADIPTWKEQGVNLVYGGWRAIVAPKGLSADQVAYWEGVLRKATSTPEWKANVKKNFWFDDFVTSAQFTKDIDKDYQDIRAVLVDLGLAK